MTNNFQRIGSDHNSGVGRLFEKEIQELFFKQNIVLKQGFAVPVGVCERKKLHKFDLGSEEPRILIECKSHKWTLGGNTPSAKMTVWNEAMYYFHVAPSKYRKILFVLKHDRAGQSLAAYYLRTYGHLVPDGVEVWELDADLGAAAMLWPKSLE
jgi:hypothetical protein